MTTNAKSNGRREELARRRPAIRVAAPVPRVERRITCSVRMLWIRVEDPNPKRQDWRVHAEWCEAWAGGPGQSPQPSAWLPSRGTPSRAVICKRNRKATPAGQYRPASRAQRVITLLRCSHCKTPRCAGGDRGSVDATNKTKNSKIKNNAPWLERSPMLETVNVGR